MASPSYHHHHQQSKAEFIYKLSTMAAPVFTETFNIQNAGQPEYRTFIVRLRDELGKLSGRRSHNLPVLPVQGQTTRWVDVILQNNNTQTRARAVKLRIRVDNLYLDAYQTQNPNTGAFDRWFVLRDTPVVIPNSTLLPFDGSYGQLVAASPISQLINVNLGKPAAVEGINSLNVATTQNSRIAEVLIVFIQLICESARFTLISDHLGPTFLLNAQNRRLTQRMIDVEHSWGTLSAALLRMDTDANYKFPPQPAIQINTYLDAVEVLGILLGGNARATVLVTFVLGDTATVTKVYGLIDSRYGDLGGDITNVLFQKEKNELVDVTPGQVITLSESELEVPFISSHVVIKSELRAENEQVIAQDHAEFPVQLSGTFEKLIPCEHGEIRVKLTWV